MQNPFVRTLHAKASKRSVQEVMPAERMGCLLDCFRLMGTIRDWDEGLGQSGSDETSCTSTRMGVYLKSVLYCISSTFQVKLKSKSSSK